ncbi:digestive organ expansion factor [Cylindrobasidium torrendii FP15055 ss-10]|uniref:U3 small nucleolar RNA-associated protein 25 n=1 Tax=Cylindrobasidium torrendii FP15055 ss-10 TaxID=1314674 RepID=A0A0D7BUZ6_9AGAR|nr:digestive organ expansion factor [Cylindrobasidium torrendii FP15055 ss-10]
MDSNTRLLTLLNVSATKYGRRKWSAEKGPSEKLNKRNKTVVTEVVVDEIEKEPEQPVDQNGAEDEDSPSDPYEAHFGAAPAVLTDSSRNAANERRWKSSKFTKGKLGTLVELVPEGASHPGPSQFKGHGVLDRLHKPYKARKTKSSAKDAQLQDELLEVLSSNADIYLSHSPWETKRSFREAISLHAINHVTKKRRRIIKNNERLTAAAKAVPEAPAPEDVQDQGFTRPSVLILLPFRNSALAWFHALTSHTPSPEFQIENQGRFVAEYGLPKDAVDKLAAAAPGTYPQDHVETFKGNVDDSFRVGIKLTRKSVKMFTEFYGCDIIMASPLGLRQSIQKEKGADYLSSIEMVIVDQMDALAMQNWEHVNFVFSHLNKLPKESHDTDFSRIKPWYLDDQAKYLRQSILMTGFETSETRALFNSTLTNVAGKIRLEKQWSPVSIPDGLSPELIQFEASNPADEPEKRFQHFTTQLLPALLKSAVQSTNTVIFVPSSFDFIRVHNYFRKQSGVTFTVLSEYSTNPEISRARQAFFSGQKAFLLVSERFHFFRRYKLRGVRNIVFYGPPDHQQFYAEMLSCPFLDDDVESQDVSCKMLFSKYDWFKLERIAGTDSAAKLVKA